MADNDKSPILNNPYEEPLYHYDTDMDGNLDYERVLEGRRPYTTLIGIQPKQVGSDTLFHGSDFESDDPNAEFINRLRSEVKQWRDGGYIHTTRVTRELLDFWFNNNERQNYQRLFFCQREAVETAIYLNEVADSDPNMGRHILNQLYARQNSVSDNSDYVLPRTAFKMATGTGKTVVMAMLILYHYINKREYHNDTRFADHFLIVAPGITIRDRLGVLFVDDKANTNDANDYYHKRYLIPNNYQHLMGGLNAAITITNYHVFEPKVFTGKKSSPLDGKMIYNSNNGEMEKCDDKEPFSSVISRVLGRNMKGKRIVVINDEAHHCYLPRIVDSKQSDEETQEGEKENAKAMVWYEGLRQMKQLGYRIQNVYDLSATPYYLKGSGYEPYSLFPWVVSDFGLVDSIESGLVKIPFLPTYDNSNDLDQPKLRNIYEHIRSELPKKGQRGARKAAKAEGKETMKEVEQAPRLPELLSLALAQFTRDYEEYDQGLRQNDEAATNLFTAPPVFIVVCNNTTVSKEVYKYIAGYETVNAEGKKICVDGHFPIFSNYRDGMPKQKPPTLIIDSEAVDNAAGTIDDEFKRVFRDEIETFRREYAILHGSGSADRLTEGDILREVVNTVGKLGLLGGHVRCVVSVSMLTEGWDANTVTHVCGVRAFGSQLLCEQVAGRALRRVSYELKKYDAKSGEELPEGSKRTKDVVLKFPPEYAHIIGVPFKTFRGGATPPPNPPKPKTVIKALPERKELEIKFPNIEGYRSDSPEGELRADYTGHYKFCLNFNDIPTETTMGNPIEDPDKNRVVLKSDYQELRDAEVVYELTRRLIHYKYSDRENGIQFQLFGRLKQIVQQWYDSQIEILGGDGSREMRRLVIFWDPKATSENIYVGIERANLNAERITGITNYYNPEGSTEYVFGTTTKEVYPTVKSHVNYVVADTDSWEQIAAKTMEQMPQVLYYVKNHFLGFHIPYLENGAEHRYTPDFIARVKTPKGEEVNLIIEISGYSNDRTGSKAAKRYYTTNYWLPAANNMQTYGRWDFVEVSDIDNIKAILTEKINQL